MKKWDAFDGTRYSGDFWACLLRIWGRRVSDKDSPFGCIIGLLLIHFRIYYNLTVLLIDFVINYY